MDRRNTIDLYDVQKVESPFTVRKLLNFNNLLKHFKIASGEGNDWKINTKNKF